MNRKRHTTAALILFLLCTAPVAAQKFEVIPFAGYLSSARIQSYEGVFRINDGFDFGLSVNYGFSDGFRVELSYGLLPTSLTYTLDSEVTPVCDLNVSYGSISAVIEFMPGEDLVPFARLGFGGVYYKPDDSDISSEKVMHFNISGGTKFYFTRNIGLRLQASLLLPIFYEGMVFEEALPGPGEGMPTKIAGVQGDFTAGLIVRF